MVTQHCVESTPWSRTKCPHSPKRMALDVAQKNQHIAHRSIHWLRVYPLDVWKQTLALVDLFYIHWFSLNGHPPFGVFFTPSSKPFFIGTFSEEHPSFESSYLLIDCPKLWHLPSQCHRLRDFQKVVMIENPINVEEVSNFKMLKKCNCGRYSILYYYYYSPFQRCSSDWGCHWCNWSCKVLR